MNIFALIRLGVFGVILFFSLITLGLSANLSSKSLGWTFPGFAVAVSILTMVIAIPMIVIDMMRKGSFVSWVATELAWSGLLWVLWLSSASLSTSTLYITGDCSLIYFSDLQSLCRQDQALQAFSWLNWLLLTGYIITVIVLSILATVKGNSHVWLSPASELSFTPTQVHGGEPKIPPPGNYGGYPSPHPGSPTAYPPNQTPVGYAGASPAPSGQQYSQFPASTQPTYGQPGYPQVAQV